MDNEVKKDLKVKEEPKAKPKEEPKTKKNLIPAKLFVKKLKAELKGKKISPPVFIAFEKTVKPIDLEENYRKIWKTTFKRD